MTPPRWLSPVGDGDFAATGAEFCDHFIRLGGLAPYHAVLDVGCGIGRMARPLTQYLTSGTYEGFDIVPGGIRWCRRHITSRYPNFIFSLADIRNPEYNPRGHVAASEYRFPYDDGRFHFAFLTSVFTHMRPPEMSHYLEELRRVLAPGGKCLATFFVLNHESRRLAGLGASAFDFSCRLPGCWSTNRQTPETAIGYEEEEVGRLLVDKKFSLQSLSFGRWCGRTHFLSFQDIAVFAKQRSESGREE
jgi:SAM-dependent methyltransferase